MDSMFTTRDPTYHKTLKRSVAQLFSMTNMKSYEPYADECTQRFLDAMRDLQGQTVDLSVWCQWYAFDMIACITFQRRFGFMEECRDIDKMISDLDAAIQASKVTGSYPELHPWQMGNTTLLVTLQRLGIPLPDPLRPFLKVSIPKVSNSETRHANLELSLPRMKLNGMGSKQKDTGRTDFLSHLRAKEANDGQISYRDIVNHLSNNM